jgi:hypothetical protein
LLSDGQCFRYTWSSFILILVFAARRPASFLNFLHPGRGTAAALASAPSQPFKAENSLFNLLTFLAQIRQHFRYVHLPFTPEKVPNQDGLPF